MKKMRTMANKKYCRLGNASKFEKRVKERINPMKMPNPPNVGTLVVWDVRSLGLATKPLRQAILIITGMTTWVMMNAVKKADIMLIYKAIFLFCAKVVNFGENLQIFHGTELGNRQIKNVCSRKVVRKQPTVLM
jgi:hypothetical protein